MIIRSQSKKAMIPLNQPVYIEEIGDEWKVSTERFFLGTYSTEEKAIKVLDMIQNVYTQYGTIKDGLGSIHGAFNIPKCFQMPLDEEVEV